jgi:hypothetical protein
MLFSFKIVVFACLTLANATASFSSDDILEMIQEQNSKLMEQNSKLMKQEGTIAELKKSMDRLVKNKGSSNGFRTLKKHDKQKQRDRNICYEGRSNDTISVWVDCSDVYYSTVDCEEDPGRRMLSHDEASRTLQEMGTKRKTCAGDPDDGDKIKRFASYDIGAVQIGKE